MKRLIAVLLMLVMAMPAALAEIYLIEDESQRPEGWSEKELLRLTAIDTDRSDAMLLQCGGENMMIDGGSQQFYDRLLALIAEEGITEFKYLYNTHPDTDHIQGLTLLMNRWEGHVGGFYTAVAKTYAASPHALAVRVTQKRNIPYVQILDGDVLTLGGATINVIRCDQNWGTNNRSAACQVVFGNSKVLLPGDCGNQALEYFIANRDHALLECDIMKAVHHGINGIVPEFLDVAQPEFIFVPNAKENLVETKQAFFSDLGAWFNGDGAIVMETDGADWYIWQLPNWVSE